MSNTKRLPPEAVSVLDVRPGVGLDSDGWVGRGALFHEATANLLELICSRGAALDLATEAGK